MALAVAQPKPRYLAIDRTRVGLRWLLSALAERILPAAFFVLVLASKAMDLPSLTATAAGATGLDLVAHLYLPLAYRALTCLFWALVVALYVMRRPVATHQADAKQKTIAFGGAFIATLIAIASPTMDGIPVVVAANLLMVAGLVLAMASLLTLGRCFGILPDVRGLVTRGLYAHVRHPLYVGEFITTLGMLLPVLSGPTTAVFAVYALLQWRRILYEETILSSTFADYDSYSRRTPRFVPRLGGAQPSIAAAPVAAKRSHA